MCYLFIFRRKTPNLLQEKEFLQCLNKALDFSKDDHRKSKENCSSFSLWLNLSNEDEVEGKLLVIMGTDLWL